MGTNRLEMLLSMVDRNPADGFSRYGLAMEYVKSGDLMTALDHFMQNKFEFSGQASAIAAKSGGAANANYRNGVVVFSQEKGGLMLEASLGGQKFTFKPLK